MSFQLSERIPKENFYRRLKGAPKPVWMERGYVGITPTIRESGSSVRGRARISKVGNRKLRNLLFLCAFNACKHNKACREVYDRIVNKGKSKKLALIAVANKLLKQCFAIAKSGLPYDEDHVSVQVRG